ncbi:hypothetical protein EJ03DRAFT_253151, partial [Teratosphaeria nubilosa]
DASSTVQLHPLVLLTISDYITRHTLREQHGPIAGTIIGQQHGRTYTLEHAFENKLTLKDEEVLVDANWFTQRLQQYRDVHKAAGLDLVALFVMGPVGGPQEAHLPMLKQVQQLTGMEGLMLLMFHGSLVDSLQGGKLPVTLYETVQEQDSEQIKFREIPFEVDSGDAEMIGVDFVAKGGGNATAVKSNAAEASKKDKIKGKGKAKEKDGDVEAEAAQSALSPEDEELIASLNAKANAIKMLNQRLDLIRTYLETLPKSYLTDATSTTAPPPDQTNHTVLRSINSLLSRVPLLVPPPPSSSSNGDAPAASSLQTAGDKEKQDVHLTSLLSALTRSVSEAQTMGSKFHILQREK